MESRSSQRLDLDDEIGNGSRANPRRPNSHSVCTDLQGAVEKDGGDAHIQSTSAFKAEVPTKRKRFVSVKLVDPSCEAGRVFKPHSSPQKLTCSLVDAMPPVAQNSRLESDARKSETCPKQQRLDFVTEGFTESRMDDAEARVSTWDQDERLHPCGASALDGASTDRVYGEKTYVKREREVECSTRECESGSGGQLSRPYSIGVDKADVEAKEVGEQEDACTAVTSSVSSEKNTGELDHAHVEPCSIGVDADSCGLASVEPRRSRMYNGVSFYKPCNSWLARLSYNGRSQFLGYHARKEDAARAVDRAVVAAGATSVKLNFPNERTGAGEDNPLDLQPTLPESGLGVHPAEQLASVQASNPAEHAPAHRPRDDGCTEPSSVQEPPVRSKYYGVGYCRSRVSGNGFKWRTRFIYKGRKRHVGYFASEEQAARAYDAAVVAARTNAPLNFPATQEQNATEPRVAVRAGSEKSFAKRPGSSSKYRGVSRCKQQGGERRWRARFAVNGVERTVGYFGTEIEAARAYDAAVREAKLNIPLNFPGEETESREEERAAVCVVPHSNGSVFKRPGSTSRYRGVSYSKWSGNGLHWRARFKVNGEERMVGYFASEEEAARAYDEGVLKAKLNIPLNFAGEGIERGGVTEMRAARPVPQTVGAVARPGRTSVYRGVSCSRRSRGNRRWRARFKVNGEERTVGYFGSEIEAARAYDAAVREAKLNIPLNFANEEAKCRAEGESRAIVPVAPEAGAAGKRPGSTSRYRGVSYCKRLYSDLHWRARFEVKGVETRVGYFASEEEAARAYDAAVREAKLNIPLNFPNEDTTLGRVGQSSSSAPVSPELAQLPQRPGRRSRYRGVSYCKRSYSDLDWLARLSANGVETCVGYYASEEEAARAYDEAVREAKLSMPLNFPGEGMDYWAWKCRAVGESGAIVPVNPEAGAAGKRPGSTSRYRGVSYSKRTSTGLHWRARFEVKGVETRVGYFASEEEAARAYDTAVREAKLNIPLNFPNEDTTLGGVGRSSGSAPVSPELARVPQRPGRTSRYRGVSYCKRYGTDLRWRARLSANGVDKILGYFASEEEAARAHSAAIREAMKTTSLNFSGKATVRPEDVSRAARVEPKAGCVGKRRGSTSKYRGVSYWERQGSHLRWRVRFRVNGVDTILGFYASEEEAARAYDAAALSMHVNPVLNFPEEESGQPKIVPEVAGAGPCEESKPCILHPQEDVQPRRSPQPQSQPRVMNRVRILPPCVPLIQRQTQTQAIVLSQTQPRVTKYRGVRPCTKKSGARQWRVRCTINGRDTHVGYYATEQEGARAYDRAILEAGEAGPLNFPESRSEGHGSAVAETVESTVAVRIARTVEDDEESRRRRAVAYSVSKYHGVRGCPPTISGVKRWQARIFEGGVPKDLGYFATEEEAAREYDRAVLRAGGRLPLNFPARSSGSRGDAGPAADALARPNHDAGCFGQGTVGVACAIDGASVGTGHEGGRARGAQREDCSGGRYRAPEEATSGTVQRVGYSPGKDQATRTNAAAAGQSDLVGPPLIVSDRWRAGAGGRAPPGERADPPVENERVVSVFRGVSFARRPTAKGDVGRWRAQLKLNGGTTHIGYYASEEEAALAYDAAVVQWGLLGYKLNFSDGRHDAIGGARASPAAGPAKPRPTRSSRFYGVTWVAASGRWMVRARPPNETKYKYLGCFDDELVAARAYDAYAAQFLGPDAKLNFPAETSPSAQARSGASRPGVAPIRGNPIRSLKITHQGRTLATGVVPAGSNALASWSTTLTRRPGICEGTGRKHELVRGSTHGSQFLGVRRERGGGGRWSACLDVQGESKCVGFFLDEMAAARAYDRAALVVYGPNAVTNFVGYSAEQLERDKHRVVLLDADVDSDDDEPLLDRQIKIIRKLVSSPERTDAPRAPASTRMGVTWMGDKWQAFIETKNDRVREGSLCDAETSEISAARASSQAARELREPGKRSFVGLRHSPPVGRGAGEPSNHAQVTQEALEASDATSGSYQLTSSDEEAEHPRGKKRGAGSERDSSSAERSPPPKRLRVRRLRFQGAPSSRLVSGDTPCRDSHQDFDSDACGSDRAVTVGLEAALQRLSTDMREMIRGEEAALPAGAQPHVSSSDTQRSPVSANMNPEDGVPLVQGGSISWCEQNSHWMAQIQVQGEERAVGMFKDKEMASQALQLTMAGASLGAEVMCVAMRRAQEQRRQERRRRKLRQSIAAVLLEKP